MGYFSELDLTRKEEYADRSYHGFEEQLLWRYEDLRDRYLELLDTDAPCVGDDYFSKDDYRYAPIGCFRTIEDIYRAMKIAKEDLESECGIVVEEEGSFDNKREEEFDPDQITIYELSVSPLFCILASAS